MKCPLKPAIDWRRLYVAFAIETLHPESRPMPDARPRSFTIVIPALNEEEAIASTVIRCLEARERIKKVAGLDDVQIIVVSDGSTDRTVEIAQGFERSK